MAKLAITSWNTSAGQYIEVAGCARAARKKNYCRDNVIFTIVNPTSKQNDKLITFQLLNSARAGQSRAEMAL